jgi:bacillithiol biosynthesis deacetylase BshB1
VASILTIGAHPDDVEIGMGGTVAALIDQGHDVVLCDLTNGEPTPRGTPERRAQEAGEAARALRVERRVTLPLPNRSLQDTVENRKVVAEVIRDVRPDLLFVPYWVDAHPDHVAAAALAEAARFYGKLTKTEMRGDPFYAPRVVHFLTTHYRLHVKPTFLFDISLTLERKLQAVGAYRSQFEHSADGRPSMWILETLRTENAYWGSLIGRPYAEPFVMREELGLQSIDGLL